MIPRGDAPVATPAHAGVATYARSAGHGRLLWLLPALLLGGTGLTMAQHYPIAPQLVCLLFVATAVTSFGVPSVALVALPALLPIAGFAPWTGWISFEEWDLLLLALAGGAYARFAMASTRPRQQPAVHAAAAGPGQWLGWLLVALMLGSQMLALARGWADAGGFVFGWFQGYREPMNSLRMAKGLVGALLLFPLWLAAHRADPLRAASWLATGLCLGLAGASLAAVWERIAFPGLLNVSSDYRTTALFWEMHVGGAALDGFLAITVPFALRELLTTRSALRGLLLAVLLVLAGYTCLTTFSRGVYLAVPMGAAIAVWLHLVQQRRAMAVQAPPLHSMFLRSGVLVATFGFAAWSLFPTSGYRGLLALTGLAMLLLALPQVLLALSRALWIAGISAGLLLSAMAWAVAGLLPKGPYLVYAASLLLTLALTGLSRRDEAAVQPGLLPAAALAGFVLSLSNLALVAGHWGGPAALSAAWAVAAGLAAILGLACSSIGVRWPASLRWQGLCLGGMVSMGSVVAAFGGGAYMADRFATTGADFDGRLQHWRHGLDMLRTTSDLLVGRGLGRYADNYALNAPDKQRQGDYRWRIEQGNGFISLVAGTHLMGYAEVLRVSQRVQVPEMPAQVSFKVRSNHATMLNVEVCQKHLLYLDACIGKLARVPARPGQWQAVTVALEGAPLTRGLWYAPKLIMFSVSTEEARHLTDVDDLVLAGPDGRNLLDNADFSEGMARWFFSSDRNHMPWHIKNMGLHLVFEQGLAGLALAAALVVGALLRITITPARTHPLAPGIAGGLTGLLCVGLFDSLLDTPRIALLFYLLLLLGWTVGLRRDPASPPTARPAAQV